MASSDLRATRKARGLHFTALGAFALTAALPAGADARPVPADAEICHGVRQGTAMGGLRACGHRLRFALAGAVMGVLVGAVPPAVAQKSQPPWLRDIRVWQHPVGDIFPCNWQPCAATVDAHYANMDAAGTTVPAFVAITYNDDWRARIPEMVARAHASGRRLTAALSLIGMYREPGPKPAALDAAIVLDPWGQAVEEPEWQIPGRDTRLHTPLAPVWEAYMAEQIRAHVDAGVDGFVIDEGAYAGEMFDFRPELLAEFNADLAARRTPAQREDLARGLGFASFAEFDYARVWRNALPPGTSKLTRALWNRRWELNMPLHVEYSGFLRRRTHAVMQRLITGAQAYARTAYGRELPLSFNLNNLDRQAIAFTDLVDSVELEISYAAGDDWGGAPDYPPRARALSTIKLAQALGLPGRVLTNLRAREDIVAHGRRNTALYRTLAAEAYAAGGIFAVEELAHGVRTDFAAVAPWYRFVAEMPALFNGLAPLRPEVGLLLLWEQFEWHPRRALAGAAAMLADEGWSFDIVFSGESVYPEDPPVARLADLAQLQRYPVLMLPRLRMCWVCAPRLGITPAHARLLLEYLDRGGRLIVFASDADLAEVRAGDPDPSAQALYGRLGAASASGSAPLLRVPEAWPAAYHDAPSETLRQALAARIEAQGAVRRLRLSGPRRAVSAFARATPGRVVVHLANLDLDREADRIVPVDNLRLALGGMPGSTVVTLHDPLQPGGVEVPVSFTGNEAVVVLPRLESWAVLAFNVDGERPGPAGPRLTALFDGDTLRAGDTARLAVSMSSPLPDPVVDLYAVLRLPDQSLLSLTPGGFVAGIVPYARNVPRLAVDRDVLAYTLGGQEPKGAYTWFTAVTKPGTLEIIGGLARRDFRITP